MLLSRVFANLEWKLRNPLYLERRVRFSQLPRNLHLLLSWKFSWITQEHQSLLAIVLWLSSSLVSPEPSPPLTSFSERCLAGLASVLPPHTLRPQLLLCFNILSVNHGRLPPRIKSSSGRLLACAGLQLAFNPGLVSKLKTKMKTRANSGMDYCTNVCLFQRRAWKEEKQQSQKEWGMSSFWFCGRRNNLPSLTEVKLSPGLRIQTPRPWLPPQYFPESPLAPRGDQQRSSKIFVPLCALFNFCYLINQPCNHSF